MRGVVAASDLAPREVEEKIAFVMSGGTEGVLSPHLTVFARNTTAHAGGNGSGKRLSVGIAHSRDFLPEEIGRKAQMEETVSAVHLAMRHAGIDDPGDVHFVQIKCPLLTSERVESALRRGCKTVTTSGYTSMGYSRGASALGVAMALGELDAVDEDCVLKDWDLFSSVASSSAGIELMHNVVIVMGNSARSCSPFVIGHAVMRNSIDLSAVLAALKSVGLGLADAQIGGPAGQYLCQGRGFAGRRGTRLPPHHARRFRRRFDAPCPRRGRWLDRRPVGHRRRLRLRRCRAPGPARRRPSRSDCAGLKKLSLPNGEEEQRQSTRLG